MERSNHIESHSTMSTVVPWGLQINEIVNKSKTSDKQRPRANLVRTVAISLLIALSFCTLYSYLSNSVVWAFRLRERSFNTIISTIKAQDIPVGKHRTFWVSRSLDAATIRLTHNTESEQSEYKIGTFRRSKDDYIITIMLKDEGHFGMYGLLYSDSPQQTSSISGARQLDEAPLLPFVGDRINDQWWCAYNNLY